MILNIFIILLSLSIILIIAGFYTKSPPVMLAGYLFLFLLGLVLLIGGLSYKSGEKISYNYTCGCCNNGLFSSGITQTCSGTPSVNCSDFDTLEAECINQCCQYDTETQACSGVTSCECYAGSLTECTRYGCEVSNSTGCTNESMIINYENKTDIYTNYSGELVQGLEINHIFGFFLCVLSVLGWVITLTNLDRFDNKSAFREYENDK